MIFSFVSKLLERLGINNTARMVRVKLAQKLNVKIISPKGEKAINDFLSEAGEVLEFTTSTRLLDSLSEDNCCGQPMIMGEKEVSVDYTRIIPPFINVAIYTYSICGICGRKNEKSFSEKNY